jgi:hypothetical protein
MLTVLRIRIRSGFKNQVRGSGSRSRVADPYADPYGSALIYIAGSGSGSRRAKMTHEKRKSEEISCFEFMDVLF